MRNMDEARLKSYEQQKSELYMALIAEERFQRLRDAKESELSKELAMILVEEAIPCILHLENRCSEKLIKLILTEMFLNCKTDTEAKEMVSEGRYRLEKEAWGTTHSQWRPNWRAVH